ncbi:WD repeat-containing protein 54 [Heteronotia binoei]|uniref:WD repeat-containing protein 54 n=1 Tax=Heteronotia binoei TaxID=13085 RepID=UPI00292CC269|nr:WD repeat-containing protein 54 [Heteronotia binoei]
MYRREKSLALKGSSSALCNNLSVLPLPAKRLTYFATARGGALQLLSAAHDGLGVSQRQLPAKDALASLSACIVTQAAWCVLPSRTLLVLTSQKGIQMYEADGSIMVYWHALDASESSPGQAVFARGIAATGQRFVCVGTSLGCVLVFDIPCKGTNVTLSEVLEEHRGAVTDIAAELCERPEGRLDLVTADDSGELCSWRSGEEFQLVSKIPASGCSCSSVRLWNGVIVAGYGSGHIRLYEAASGTLRAEVAAHARWIYALDVAPLSGKLLSGAEDSFVEVWGLAYNPDTEEIEIKHCQRECVTDTQICGARFCDPEGRTFAVTGYDLSEIIRYVQL